MKHTITVFLPLLSILAVMTSCIGKDSPVYTGTEMCTILSESRLLSDSGPVMNLSGADIGAIPDSLKRVMIGCKILGHTDGAEDEYDITLLSYSPVTITDAVRKSAGKDLGNDAVNVESAWFGGGYLNALTCFTQVKGSKTVHTVDIEIDDLRSDNDTIRLKFHHNSFGESFDHPEISIESLETVAQYYSFPLGSIIPAEVESTVLQMECEWHISSDGILDRETETYLGYLTFNRQEKQE